MIAQLFPRQLNRLQYLIRLSLYDVVIVLLVIYFVIAREVDVGSLAEVDILTRELISLTINIPKIYLLDIPRMRHVGRSPWYLLLFLVPGVGGALQLLLLVLPTYRRQLS